MKSFQLVAMRLIFFYHLFEAYGLARWAFCITILFFSEICIWLIRTSDLYAIYFFHIKKMLCIFLGRCYWIIRPVYGLVSLYNCLIFPSDLLLAHQNFTSLHCLFRFKKYNVIQTFGGDVTGSKYLLNVSFFSSISGIWWCCLHASRLLLSCENFEFIRNGCLLPKGRLEILHKDTRFYHHSSLWRKHCMHVFYPTQFFFF